eukprot:830219_1
MKWIYLNGIKASVSTLNQRGEVPASRGEYQTVSFGLDEFMTLCGTNNIIPYLQVNIIQGQQSAIDLIEYLIGNESTTFGSMRINNGHSEPYIIKYIELGNEPNSNYALNFSYSHSGKGYAILAESVGAAILNQWQSIEGNTNDIYLISATEMQFQLADWISVDVPTVNLVRLWNRDVYNSSSIDVSSTVNGVSGHYYSYFGSHHGDIQTVFEYLMSGSQVMHDTVIDHLSTVSESGGVWVSEYGTVIQNEASDAILPQYLSDFQAGLNIANILIGILSNIDVLYHGAHIHNLAEEVGFGMMKRNKSTGNWYLRPTGIVFKLLSNFANQTVHNCTVSDNDPIDIIHGDGSVPSGIRYDRLKCIASHEYIAILNLNYNTSVNVSVSTQTKGTWWAMRWKYRSILMMMYMQIMRLICIRL